VILRPAASPTGAAAPDRRPRNAILQPGSSPRVADRPPTTAASLLGAAVALALLACDRKPPPPGASTASAPASASVSPPVASASAASSGSASASAAGSAAASAGPAPLLCPEGMVAIPAEGNRRAFCIDQYEASLVDRATKTPLSPYYPPHRRLAARLAERWEKERLEVGNPRARETPLPPLPAFQRDRDVEFMAVSRPRVVPSGYLSGHDAELACRNANKRLCKHDEWIAACQGRQRRQFPYGDSYQQGACNICRALHPAAVLHDDASKGHLDPRLNLVKEGNDPLLRPTGATKACRSDWGEDQGIYDMNGNLDEWVEDEKGRFVGGFFSRWRKDGCRASITAHPKGYFDYSTGVRCCLSSEE
jgi:sulfatase modifying factor 1